MQLCTALKFYAVPVAVPYVVMEINAVIVCSLFFLFGAVALKVLQKKCERRHMIPVCTWRTAGEKVHLSDTCGGQGPRDFWSIPRKHKKFVKVEWCKKCAKEYMV